MIDVRDVLGRVPHFATFCSVRTLHELVGRLQADSRFVIEVAGTSANGVPIHRVRFGSGSVKALVVGGPHCKEPIGSLTVFSLLSLLEQHHQALVDADVEWHIVPCIDPDGAVLNEGWTQKPFAIENYVRNYYVQAPRDQVDMSFPIDYKKAVFDQPSCEARVLQGLLDRIRPDFFYTLHNASSGSGAWYAISRDIGKKYYRELHELLKQYRIPLQLRSPATALFPKFDDGVVEMPSWRKAYDSFERQGIPIPEMLLEGGASSGDYLEGIKSDALIFCTEIACFSHPDDASEKETSHNLRQLKLRIDADNKFLATVILEEWDKVCAELDVTSPFYRKIFGELVAVRGKLHSGGAAAAWAVPIQHILFNPQDARMAAESDCFRAYIAGRLTFLCNAYSFVRLLKATRQVPVVCQAVERTERAFEEAFVDLGQNVDLAAFEIIDCDTLARVQLGSGLIALNSLLDAA